MLLLFFLPAQEEAGERGRSEVITISPFIFCFTEEDSKD